MNQPKLLATVMVAVTLLLATLACTTPQSQSAEAPVTAPTAKAIVASPTDTTEPRAAPVPTDTIGPPTPTSVQVPVATAVPPTNTLEPTNAPLATSTPESQANADQHAVSHVHAAPGADSDRHVADYVHAARQADAYTAQSPPRLSTTVADQTDGVCNGIAWLELGGVFSTMTNVRPQRAAAFPSIPSG